MFPKAVSGSDRCRPYRGHVDKMAALRDRQCRNGVIWNERGRGSGMSDGGASYWSTGQTGRGSGVSSSGDPIGPQGQIACIGGHDFAISRRYIRRWHRFLVIRAIKC